MRRYVTIALAVALFLLAIFAVVEFLAIGLLTDPSDTLDRGGLVVALIAVGLLAADVVLPIPSSIVMVSLGAAYGLVGGALLGSAGSVLGALIAFAIGRRAEGALDRIVSPSDRETFAGWFAARGDLAIIVSRPLPIIAETVAGLAGTTTMRARRFVPVVILGTLPVAFAYAAAGAAVADVDNWAMIVAAVVAVAGGFWTVDHLIRRRPDPKPSIRRTVTGAGERPNE